MLKVWWPDATLFVYFDIKYFYSITFIHYTHPSPVSEVPLHLLIASKLSGKTELRCTQMSSAAPNWDTPPPTDLRCTLTQLRRTLLNYAAPYWAPLYPTELRRILLSTPHTTDLRRPLTQLYAAPLWVTPHPTELRRTLTVLRCTLTELCRKLQN